MTNFIKKAFTVSVVVTTIIWAVGVAAFLPMGVSAAAAGDLIKKDGLSTVYYLGADSKRYVFPSADVYFSWYSDFSGVKTVSATELESYSLGGNVVVRPGTKLIKITTDPKVYAVEANGAIRHIASETIATSLFGSNWAKRVIDVADSYFTNYHAGTQLATATYPAGSLVKTASSGDIYYINASGQKQKFSSMDAFNANRFKLADVITASDLASYTAGTDITGAVSTMIDTSQGGGGSAAVVGSISTSLSSSTPASTSIPKGAAEVPFTIVNFTAGAEAVNITGLKVTHSGLGVDSNINAVKLFVDGLQKGTSQTLGSTHVASFSLSTSPIEIPANTTKAVTIAADIISGVTAYDSHIFGIAAATDVTASGTVSGSFPINGNNMSLTNVTLGTTTITPGSMNPTDAGYIDSDATNYRFSSVKIAAGSTEGLVISQITAIKNGTASSADVKNISLYNEKTGTTIGTVAALDSAGKAVFSNLNLVIAKGDYVEVSVKADMANSGSGRTLGFDFHDGTSYSMSVKGATYGYGILPTANAAFCLAGRTDYSCPRQTINQGYLTVNKSSAAPVTGKIGSGSYGTPLMAFDFVAAGEPINVSQTILKYVTGTALREEITNVTLYKADGTILAGPKSGSNTGAGTETLTFTDSYTIPVGTTIVYVKADIASATEANDTVYVTMDAGSITAKGANSGKTTYTTSTGSTVPPAAAATGNTLTVSGPALKVITAGTPMTGSVVLNSQDYTFANFDLDASASGEDIKVTALAIEDVVAGGTGDYTGINNLELWGDADNSDTDTTIAKLATSNSTATNAQLSTFTFLTPLKVKKGTTSRLALKADVVNLTASTSHAFSVDSANATRGTLATDVVTAIGYTTGSTATKTYSDNGKVQTVVSVGTLKVEVGADRPAAAQFVAGTTGNSMMSYKFTSAYEPIDVTSLYIATTGATAGSDIANVKLYLNGVLIGNTSGYTLDAGGDAYVALNNGTFVVPKDSYSTLTIKVDLADKTTLTDAATLEIGLGDVDGNDSAWGANGAYAADSYLIVANGQNSGTTITATNIDSVGDGSGNVAASYVQYLYDGILTVSLASGSPSGNATAGANKEVMRLDLTATGDDITVDEMEFCVAGTATGVTGTGDVTIKSSDLGTTYATMTQSEFDTYWDDYGGDGTNAGTFYPMDPGTDAYRCFSIGRSGATGVDEADGAEDSTGLTLDLFDVTLSVAAGTTKTVKVFGDTTGAATTLTLQLSLQQNGTSAAKATTVGLTWENASANVVGDGASETLTKNLPVNGGSLLY